MQLTDKWYYMKVQELQTYVWISQSSLLWTLPLHSCLVLLEAVRPIFPFIAANGMTILLYVTPITQLTRQKSTSMVYVRCMYSINCSQIEKWSETCLQCRAVSLATELDVIGEKCIIQWHPQSTILIKIWQFKHVSYWDDCATTERYTIKLLAVQQLWQYSFLLLTKSKLRCDEWVSSFLTAHQHN